MAGAVIQNELAFCFKSDFHPFGLIFDLLPEQSAAIDEKNR
jgi:hypothetical protein